MNKNLYILSIAFTCFTGTAILQADDTRDYASPQDRILGLALLSKNENVEKIGYALQAGADPNNRSRGASAFLLGFNNALERDENGRITGIDPEGSKIVHLLAAAGGNPKELDLYLVNSNIVVPNSDPDTVEKFPYIPNEDKFKDSEALGQMHALLTSLEKMFLDVQAYNRQNAWFKFLYNSPKLLHNWPLEE